MREDIQEELNALVQSCLKSLEEMVGEQESFPPYAISIDSSGEGQLICVEPTLDPEEAAVALENVLKQQAAVGDLRSCAILMDVAVKNHETGQRTDAVRIAIEHREAEALGLVLPYVDTSEGRQYGELQQIATTATVFDDEDSRRSDPRSSRDFLREIPRLAAVHVLKTREIAGVELDYDEGCFAVCDRLIRDGWGDETPAMLDPVVATFGSFVGEAIRELHGGEWDFSEEHGAFLTNLGESKTSVYPFERVRRRFENGSVDSLEAFYLELKEKL